MGNFDSDGLRRDILSLVERYAAEHTAQRGFVPGETYIPPSGKLIGTSEIRLMTEAALDGWLTTGRFNDQFEKSLARFIGTRYAMTVNSGSSANLVAFTALTSPKLGERAIKPGDEVITVAAGFPTTVNPILQNGAVPVFVDVALGTYNIDVSKIETAITPKTRAIMLAHTLGNPFDLDAITALCEAKKLWLIEDCCDALGSTYRGRHVGTFGDIATLSFYPAHHITMGEGGAVFTKNSMLARIAESIRDWGRDCYCKPGEDNTCAKRFDWCLGDLPHGYDHKYTYSHMGYNLKITDMQAACALGQLEKLPDFVTVRRNNFEILSEALSSLSDKLILPKATEHAVPSWFGFPITLRETAKIDRTRLLKDLEAKRVGTRLLFAGNITKQPYMKGRNWRVAEHLHASDLIMSNTFWIGLQPSLTVEMLHYSAQTIKELIRSQ